MEIIRASEVHRIEAADTCVAFEFPTSDLALNIARVHITGRYPKQGTMRNNEVKEIVYVESGEGEVTINSETQKIGRGDVIFYEKGEQVCWNGTLTLIIACTPRWTKEQHEFLP